MPFDPNYMPALYQCYMYAIPSFDKMKYGTPVLGPRRSIFQDSQEPHLVCRRSYVSFKWRWVQDKAEDMHFLR